MAEFHPFILSSLCVMVILQFGNLANATPVFVMTAKASLRFGFIGNSVTINILHIWLSVSMKTVVSCKTDEKYCGVFKLSYYLVTTT